MISANISVLLFTHNNNYYGAGLTLNSLINQTMHPEEIIIMDNSLDNNDKSSDSVIITKKLEKIIENLL